MKEKRLRKIAFLAIAMVMALVILSCLLIQQIGLPIKAYAESVTNEAIETETFVDMRANAKDLVHKEDLSDEEKREMRKIYADWDFQHNDDNFEYITKEEVAEIIDSRYGVTLGDEAKAIKVVKEENGNLKPKISDEPTLTVFTYGQGGKLGHWSNRGVSTGIDEDYSTFVYDYNSMIEVLRRMSDADVYVVKTKALNITGEDNPNELDFKISYTVDISISEDNDSESNLMLYKLEPNESSYTQVETKTTIIDNKDYLTKIEDMSKHNIIIFESNDSTQYHNFVYNELNIILTQISYDYLLTIGEVPKLNMISHSTGGVWNMMWANKHPFNVEALYALASPFSGSTTGMFLYDDWDKMSKTVLKGAVKGLYDDSIAISSGLNNVDMDRCIELNRAWNEAVELNDTLRCYAFTGLPSADLVLGLISPDLASSIVGKSWLLQIAIVEVVGLFAEAVVKMIAAGILQLATVILGPYAIPLRLAIDGLIAYEIYEIIDAFGGIAVYLLDNLWIDGNGELCLKDDCIVSYYSALGYKPQALLAEGEDRETEWYNNFIRFQKTFRPDNTDLKRKNTKDIAVPHNLEAQDADIISDLTENIVMGNPDTRYDWEESKDGTVCIKGINRDFYNEQIIIPETIDGKEITRIDNSGRSILRSVKGVNYVKIGDSVKYIGDNAFDGASSITEIELNQGLQYIGSRAFQNTNISTISFPNSVEEIGSYAFANTNLQIVEECEGDSNLRIVGEGVFEGTDFLNNAESNVIIGQVLIKYKSDKTFTLNSDDKLKYFAQKCFEGSNIKTLDVSGFSFEDNSVPDYFLYGATELETVLFPENIIVIGNHAFEGTDSLISLVIPYSVEVIGVKAFASSNIGEIYLETPFTPIISTDTFEQCSNLSAIWVKKYAQADFINAWCDNSNPFALNAEIIKTKSASLNFYDDGVIVFKENDIYYHDYISNYTWMQEGGYTKDGYYFLGWIDSEGKQYYAGSLLEFDLNEEWALYANWQIENYNIWYESYGGEFVLNDEITEVPYTVTINLEAKIPDSIKAGYIFNGWYNNPEFNGSEIKVLTSINHDLKLYAKFDPIDIAIKYDITGIDKIERQSDTFIYGERFYAPIPEKTGYAFAGWYTEDGERVTGINGVSLKKCTFVEDVMLYAQWTAKSFVIEFNNGIISYVLGNDGLTSDASSVLIGQQVNVNSQAFINAFKREGYIFDHFADEDGQYLDFSNGVPDLGENFSTFVISPIYTAEKYTFTLYDGVGNFYREITVSYDDIYDFSISRVGYDFIGWADKNGKIVLEEKSGVIVTDFTPNLDGDGTISLYANWTAVKGNINFDSTGGTKVNLKNDYVSNFAENLPSISVPTRNGYDFLGFYDEQGKQYINESGLGIKAWDKTDSYVTLYAYWSLKNYTLHYYYQDHINSYVKTTFDVEHPVIFPTSGFEKVGFTFVGWCTDASGVDRITDTNGYYSDLSVYAKWTENTFTIAKKDITISSNNCSVNLNKISTGYSYCIITLSSNVNKILISNAAKIHIVIISEAYEINIYLRQAEFTSLAGYSAIEANDINIYVISDSKIIGANGANGTNGTAGSYSYSHGTPSNSSSRAGSGNSGSTGGNGGNGQVAIDAATISIFGITSNSNASLTLVGGNGGNGGKGGAGGNGAYGADGQTGGGKDNGVSGGHGGNGGKGGTGGKGAYAIYANKIVNSLKNLTLSGGNGGNGGTGGNGGNGGHGGKGANNSGFLFIAANYAGKGGDGGDAGRAGEGGSNGSGANGASVSVEGTSCNLNKGTNGSLGEKGKHGSAGNGGNGGDGPIGGKNGSPGNSITD